MNIVILSELYYPHGSGAELATYLYAKNLSAAGHKVRVITNQFHNEQVHTKENNLEIYRIPLYNDKTSSVKYSTLKRIDILFSKFVKDSISSSDLVYIPRLWFTGILLAKHYNKPVITHLHDYIPICPLSNVYDYTKELICKRPLRNCSIKCIYAKEKNQQRPLREGLLSTLLNSTLRTYPQTMLKMSDAIVCVSKEQRSILLKKAPQFRNKTTTIYNPLPETENQPIIGRNFGYFGGLDQVKGFQVLYKSLLNIRNNSHSAPLIEATKIGKINQTFADKLKSLGFSINGQLDAQKYRNLYKSISSVIIPSIWPEPWPYVTVDAMRHGRIVIASDIGGIPEQVGTSKGAFLFKTGDHRELSEYINKINNFTKDEIKEIGQKNKENFLERFSTEKSTEAFGRLCEILI